MEPKGSLMHSQQPAIGSCSFPHKLSPTPNMKKSNKWLILLLFNNHVENKSLFVQSEELWTTLDQKLEEKTSLERQA
jgi:hypothetical protein